MREVRRKRLTTDAEAFSSALAPHLDGDLGTELTNDGVARPTEPFPNVRRTMDNGGSEGSDLLDEQEEEASEGEALEGAMGRSRSVNAAPARQSTGAEDALHSYLRDIRGLGLLTHAEEIDLARRAAAGDELARRKLIESKSGFYTRMWANLEMLFLKCLWLSRAPEAIQTADGRENANPPLTGNAVRSACSRFA